MAEAGAAAPGASGQGGAAPGAAAGGNGAAGAAAPAPVDWVAGISDEGLRGYVQTKGWKEPSQLADSYRNFEKLQGAPQERIIRLPEKADDPSWSEINFKLGVPKEAKEYQFEIPKEHGDEKFAGKAKEWFHKNGVPRTKAESIVKEWNTYVAETVAADKAEYATNINAQKELLKKEWGAAHDQNMESAKRAAQAFGWLGTPMIDKLEYALGVDGTMKFLHSLNSKIGEDSFVTGNKNNSSFTGMMTPAQAKEQIANRKKDVDFVNRLMKKDATTVAEWNQLNKMAAGEQA